MTPRRMKLRELTLLAASMITIIATTAIAAALPQMSEAYAAVADAQFLVKVALTLPALSIALSALFMGVIVDRWGRKDLFLASLLLYGVAGVSGFLLTSLHHILVSRFILGIAVAGISTCATALISDYYEKSELNKFMGRQSVFMGLGNVIFVSFGGVLAGYGWRLPFLIYSISFLILPGVIFAITEPPRTSRSDALGSRTAVPALSLPKVTLIYVLGFVNMVIYFMVPVNLPFHLGSFSGISHAKVGLLLSAVGLAWGISSLQYHRLKTIATFEQVVMWSFAVMGTAYLILGAVSGYLGVLIAMILIGIGLGAFIPNLNAWLLSFAPASMKGRLIGGLVFFVFLGQFLSPVITKPLSAKVGIANSYVVGGAVLLSISFVCALLYRGKASARAAAESR